MQWTVFFALVALAASHPHNIPVKVIYDHHSANPRNLQPTIQQEIFGDEPKVVAVKNLDAKVQLSPDELNQAVKHLPVQPTIEIDIAEAKPEAEQHEKIVVPEENLATKTPQTQTNENAPDNNWHSYLILQQAQEIVTNSLDKLKANLADVMENRDKEIEDLRVTINAHLKDLKQAPANNVTGGIQNVFNQLTTFVTSFGGGNQNNNSQSDNNNNNNNPNFVTNIVNTIQNAFSGISGNNTGGQSDTASNSTNQGPFGAITQAVGNVFNNFRPGGNQNGSQGDEAESPNFAQNFFNGISNFINGGSNIQTQVQQVVQDLSTAIPSPAKSTPAPPVAHAERTSGEVGEATNNKEVVKPTTATKVDEAKEEIMTVVE